MHGRIDVDQGVIPSLGEKLKVFKTKKPVNVCLWWWWCSSVTEAAASRKYSSHFYGM